MIQSREDDISGTKYTAFIVTLKNCCHVWTLHRRFSQFVDLEAVCYLSIMILNQELIKRYETVILTQKLPKKILAFFQLSAEVIESRKLELDAYMKALLANNPNLLETPILLGFLHLKAASGDYCSELFQFSGNQSLPDDAKSSQWSQLVDFNAYLRGLVDRVDILESALQQMDSDMERAKLRNLRSSAFFSNKLQKVSENPSSALLESRIGCNYELHVDTKKLDTRLTILEEKQAKSNLDLSVIIDDYMKPKEIPLRSKITRSLSDSLEPPLQPRRATMTILESLAPAQPQPGIICNRLRGDSLSSIKEDEISNVRPFDLLTMFRSKSISNALANPIFEGYLNWWAVSLLPNKERESRRFGVVTAISQLLQSIGASVYPYGSYAMKCYLPDADVDVTCIVPTLINKEKSSKWLNIVMTELIREVSQEEPRFNIQSFSFVNAVHCQLIKCQIGFVDVDISLNQVRSLASFSLFEHINRKIGSNHLFKKSLILIKVWAEKEAGIVGSQHGFLSSYAIRVMMLFIFNAFHSMITSPGHAVFLFWEYFAFFNWKDYALSIFGPVKLIALPSQFILDDSSPCSLFQILDRDSTFLLDESILNTHLPIYEVPSESEPRSVRTPFFPVRALQQSSGRFCKWLNILDPMDPFNNIGRSVQQQNVQVIVNALSGAASRFKQQLGLLSSDTDRKRSNLSGVIDKATCSTAKHVVVEIFNKSLKYYSGAVWFHISKIPDVMDYHNPVVEELDEILLPEMNFVFRFFADFKSQILSGSEKLDPETTIQNAEVILVELIVHILAHQKNISIGKLGSLLHSLTGNHGLSSWMKEKYGGLKKLVECHPQHFSVSIDHPFNPTVSLRPISNSALFDSEFKHVVNHARPYSPYLGVLSPNLSPCASPRIADIQPSPVLSPIPLSPFFPFSNLELLNAWEHWKIAKSLGVSITSSPFPILLQPPSPANSHGASHNVTGIRRQTPVNTLSQFPPPHLSQVRQYPGTPPAGAMNHDKDSELAALTMSRQKNSPQNITQDRSHSVQQFQLPAQSSSSCLKLVASSPSLVLHQSSSGNAQKTYASEAMRRRLAPTAGYGPVPLVSAAQSYSPVMHLPSDAYAFSVASQGSSAAGAIYSMQAVNSETRSFSHPNAGGTLLMNAANAAQYLPPS